MRRILLSACTLITVLAAVVSVSGQSAPSNPEIGTWKMNMAKSKFDPPNTAPKGVTVTIEALGNGGVKVTVDRVNGDGSHSPNSYTANYDGKDYPYTTGAGPNGGDTTALKRIDAYTVDTTEKKAGKVVRTNRMVYSKDGKVRTGTAKGTNTTGQPTNTVTVWDRQ